MIHPLVRLIFTEPNLLAHHLGAYAELIASEAVHVRNRWTVRLLLAALALCCIGVAAVLAGVALMLWAVTPNLSDRATWALIAAPLIPTVVAVVAGLVAQRSTQNAFTSVKEQVSADIRMLQEVSAS